MNSSRAPPTGGRACRGSSRLANSPCRQIALGS
jgi:hypothetical protein